MEHIIASNLSKHLNKHDVLYELQHGFRVKRSRETQLIDHSISRKLGKAAIFGETNRFNTLGFQQSLQQRKSSKTPILVLKEIHLTGFSHF